MQGTEFLSDPRLSWSAKGLYAWLLMQDDNNVLVMEALKVCPDKDELTRALEELTQFGFMALDNPMFGFGGSNVHQA